MAILDWIRGLFDSDESPAPQDLRNARRPPDSTPPPPPPPPLSYFSVDPGFSPEERERRLERYVAHYQHHALREAAMQLHPELVKGLNSEDRYQRQFGLRHSWFKVPLMFGVEASMQKAKEYIEGIAHERHHIGEFTVHVLTMPKPERSLECAHIAIAWRDGEKPPYPDRSQTARFFTLEMMSDQSFVFCEWKQERHLNYGNVENSPSVFVNLVTEKLTLAAKHPVAPFNGKDAATDAARRPSSEALRPNPANGAAANPQTLVGAMEEYKRSSDAKRQAIEGWLAPRLAEKPEVAKVLDTIVLKFVQDRFGPAGDQALGRIAGHIKRFPSDPILREVLAQQMFSRIQVGLPTADLRRDIEQQIPEWKPLSAANSDILEKYLELLSLMQEMRIKLGLAQAVLPVGGNA